MIFGSNTGIPARRGTWEALLAAAFLALVPALSRAAEEPQQDQEEQPPAAPPAAKEAGPGTKGVVLDLTSCLKKSTKNHPAIMAAQYKLVAMKKQLDEAHWRPFSNIGMTTLLAPMSKMEGNAVYSPQGEFDVSSDMGVWIKLDIQAGFPIFTFGKIKSYWKMAEEGVNVGHQELKKQVNEIGYEVRRAWYTVLFVRQMDALLSEGMDYLDEAQKRIQEDLDQEKGEATMTDLLKVKAYRAQVESNLILLRGNEGVALSGLKFLTGEPALEIAGKEIAPEEGELKTLTAYMDQARKNRPELSMLDSAVKVGKANVKLGKSSYLPDFVLVGKYTFAYANKVQDQKTPFASDPYNTNSGGVALLMNYPFDFVPNYFRLDKAKAELDRVQFQKEAALGAFMLEVEKAYNDAVAHKERIEVLKKGKKAAKGWIVATYQNYEAGMAELKDFTEALGMYFMVASDYYKAVYDYNVSLASLRLVTGGGAIH